MAGLESQADRLKIDYRLTKPIPLHAKFEIRGFTALLGHSGAGKTSLLKTLAGLLPGTGTPWPASPPEARPIGYLPQGSALFPHLTALENAAFALRGPRRFAMAQTMLDELGIGPLANRNAAILSGGEAQRVGLARALARQPSLLLLDEPAAALDGASRDAVLAQLINFVIARKILALAATHDPAIAAQADWLALLADGRIIREGTPRALYDDPQTAAAAALLGFENIWEEHGSMHAIRAEDIEIAATGISARISSRREHGRDLRLHCTAPYPLTVLIKNGETSTFEPGSEIYLKFPAEKIRRLLF